MRNPHLAFLSAGVLPLAAFGLAALGTLSAQIAANTASIAGAAREQNGKPVPAIVTVSSGAFVQRAFASSDGSFRFAKLPRGSYFLCAQAPSIGPREDPFLDTCALQSVSSHRVTVSPGQTRTGALVTLERGYLLTIRVNDPGKLLPSRTVRFCQLHVYMLPGAHCQSE